MNPLCFFSTSIIPFANLFTYLLISMFTSLSPFCLPSLSLCFECVLCIVSILSFILTIIWFFLTLYYWYGILLSLHWSLKKAFLSLLAILWNSAFRCLYLSFYPLLFASLLFTAICKASPESHFAFLHFFSIGMVLIPVSWMLFTLLKIRCISPA